MVAGYNWVMELRKKKDIGLIQELEQKAKYRLTWIIVKNEIYCLSLNSFKGSLYWQRLLIQSELRWLRGVSIDEERRIHRTKIKEPITWF